MKRQHLFSLGLVAGSILIASSGLMGAAQAAEGRHAAAAAGAVGGLAAGAILGNAMQPQTRVYESAPAPVYEDDYGSDCRIVRRRVWVEGYGWRVRRTEVCD